MESGKISPELMEKAIFPFLGAKRPEVLVHSKIGEDSSVIDFGEYVAILSTDPITGASEEVGRLAVHIACNDIAACGGEPIGILTTVLFPEGTTEKEIEKVIKQIHNTASEINIEVLGGHTEVTSAVDKIVVSSTSLGKAYKDNYVTSSGARPGDSIIITKSAGIEGAAIIASDFYDDLKGKMDENQIEKAKSFIKDISVIPEGRIGAKEKATAMHDITEGGVLGAAYEVALASGVGVLIDEASIPIEPETQKICDIFNLNPLALISSGSMLITAKDGDNMVKKLSEANIKSEIIGKITEKDFIIKRKSGKEEFFTPPKRDELYKCF